MTERVFISSVQREFAEERRAIRDFIERDPLMRRFFTAFLFEELPASDRRADGVYLAEVDRCAIFVSLLGNDYGSEDASGLSPTAREFGTRAEGSTTSVQYELPREAVAEAIVNAVVHRDYASNASVQVMLFSDRLEMWNPGELPSTLSLAALREPHPSVPRNPLLAGPMYLAGYIEKAGTGTLDILKLCRDAGLPSPEFRQEMGLFKQVFTRKLTPEVTGEVTGEVLRLLSVLHGQMSRQDLQASLGLRHEEHFRQAYLVPALELQAIEMTRPDAPRSSKQQYRLTAKGRGLLAKAQGGGGS